MNRVLLLLLIGASLCGCSSDSEAFTSFQNPSEGAPGEAVQSSRARDPSPNASDEELGELTAGNAEFAWRFYHEVAKPGENLFFSPYSLSVALAMTWAGARGTTESQIAEAMHFTLRQDRLHAAFNQLDLELATRAEASDVTAPLPFMLNVSNALFGQEGFTFLDPFLDTLAENYGAGMQLMDFAGETEASRLAINDWIAERTNDRIEELLAAGTLTSDARLVLVNAILFTASWRTPFDEAETLDALFQRVDGSETLVATMRGSVEAPYVDGEGFQAVELPYDGGQLSMLLVVPDEGQFDAVERTLSAGTVSAIRGTLREHQVNLALPKFSFSSDIPSSAPLKSMGMLEAFEWSADFSGMNETDVLYISDVVHQAFVAVDENGTEAAAATGVVFFTDSSPPSATLTIDRPFIFAIVDRPTGAVLFVGRVLDPSA
ncbi:MAG: serpin family protein [Myxococcales bacterium]|nr:serpin family protein [Myxococcales bacterium]